MFEANIKSKIRINEICHPIMHEIAQIDSEYKKIAGNLASDAGSELYSSVSRIPGKRLRQSLLLLPAMAILPASAGEDKKNDNTNNNRLIKVSALSEIAYGAARLHGEIGYASKIKNKKSKKGIIENDLAVLTGDVMQTLAFLAASDIFPNSLMKEILKQTEKNCYMQISEEIEKMEYLTKESYLNSIKNKIDVLMGTFTRIAAYLSNADSREQEIFEKCVLNLGMAYQIMEDRNNESLKHIDFDPLLEIKELIENARSAVMDLKESVYKRSLDRLMDYFIDFSQNKIKKLN